MERNERIALIVFFLILIACFSEFLSGSIFGPIDRDEGKTLRFFLGRIQALEQNPIALSLRRTETSREHENPAPRPNVARALIENFAFLSLSMTNYWLKYADFIEDWQYELNWWDQKKRFFTLQAVRFDSNNFRLNWTHSLAGSIYYNFARSNYWTVESSALLTVVTSLTWEYMAEWREIISINDNIFTGLGGIVTGEPLFQSALYLLDKKHWLVRSLAWLINPIAAGNRLLDARRGYSHRAPDLEHWFFQIGGERTLRDSQLPVATFWHVGMNQRLGYLDRALEGGEDRVHLPQVSFTQWSFLFRFSGVRVEDGQFLMKSAFSGLLQRIGNKPSSEPARGSFFWLGWAGALRFYQRRAVAPYDSDHDVFLTGWEEQVPMPTRFIDKWAILDVFGLEYLLRRHLGRFTLSSEIALYPSFSLINAYALDEYTRQRTIRDTKTTLKNYGYYYGLGGTAEWSLFVRGRNWEAGQELLLHVCRSLQGADRFAPVRDDFAIWDARLLGKWSLVFRPKGGPVGLALQFDSINRWGKIADAVRRGSENRLSLSLRYYL